MITIERIIKIFRWVSELNALVSYIVITVLYALIVWTFKNIDFIFYCISVVFVFFCCTQIFSYIMLSRKKVEKTTSIVTYKEDDMNYRKKKNAKGYVLIYLLLLTIGTLFPNFFEFNFKFGSIVDIFLANAIIFMIFFYLQFHKHNVITTFFTMVCTSLIGSLIVLIGGMLGLTWLITTLYNFLGAEVSFSIPKFPIVEIAIILNYQKSLIIILAVQAFIFQSIVVRNSPPYALGTLKKSLKLIAVILMLYSSLLILVEDSFLKLDDEELIEVHELALETDDDNFIKYIQSVEKDDVVEGLKTLIFPYSSGLVIIYFYLEFLSSKYTKIADQCVCKLFYSQTQTDEELLFCKMLLYGGDSYYKYIHMYNSMLTAPNTTVDEMPNI